MSLIICCYPAVPPLFIPLLFLLLFGLNASYFNKLTEFQKKNRRPRNGNPTSQLQEKLASIHSTAHPVPGLGPGIHVLLSVRVDSGRGWPEQVRPQGWCFRSQVE